MRLASAACVLTAAACSPDEGWPESPPAEAVSSCVYERTPFANVSKSTLWFDAVENLIRVDGVTAGDGGYYKPATFYLEYDGDGRLVSERGPDFEYRYRYFDDRIDEDYGDGEKWISQLVEGRIVRSADELGNFDEFTYDTEGLRGAVQ